jgi:hypothetical protein
MNSHFQVSASFTVRSPAEKPWLECGVVGYVMLCERQREIKTVVKHLMLLSIMKKTLISQKFYSESGCASSDVSVRSESESLSLLLLSVANVNSQQLYVFAMNNKTSLLSNNTPNKCTVYRS